MIWWVICENLLRIGFRNEFLTFTSENEVDLDELHILKITFRNGLEIGMGNFPQHFPQHFPQIFPQEFPARISRKIFPQQFQTRFPARFSHNNFQQQFPARFFHNNFPEDFPATISHKISYKNFVQEFPANISHKIFPQYFPKLDPDWLVPHHPIPNGKFPPVTAFLKLAFSPSPCPTRFSHKIFPQEFPTRISHKQFPQTFPTNISLQDFPANISCKIFPQDFPELDPDWLAPNAKFPPITALLNRPTYHKSAKVSPPPFPQILWEPKINE